MPLAVTIPTTIRWNKIEFSGIQMAAKREKLPVHRFIKRQLLRYIPTSHEVSDYDVYSPDVIHDLLKAKKEALADDIYPTQHKEKANSTSLHSGAKC